MTRTHVKRLVLGGVLLWAIAGCAGRPPAQLATDELNAGLAASSQGNTDQATTHYKACVKLDSTNQFCIFNLGVIAQTAGRAAEAENDYRLALLLDPQFPSPMFNLAIIRANAGSTQEAIGLYRQFIGIRPEIASAHLNLSQLLTQTGDTVGAARELAAAIQLDPTLAHQAAPSAPANPTPAPSAAASP